MRLKFCISTRLHGGAVAASPLPGQGCGRGLVGRVWTQTLAWDQALGLGCSSDLLFLPERVGGAGSSLGACVLAPLLPTQSLGRVEVASVCC